MLKHTPLYNWHVAEGANITEFAGYKMPLHYKTGIIEEHRSVRTKAGLFDLCHMGQIKVKGRQSSEFLDYVLTQKVSNMQVGQVRYGLLLNFNGGTIDDLMVYKRKDEYVLVVNAANKEKDYQWLVEQKGLYDVEITEISDSYGIIGLQGPVSEHILAPLVEHGLGNLKHLRFIETDFFEVPAIVSRTGYTGEDGFEIYLPLQAVPALWTQLLREGRSLGLVTVGLGARDTLRLEMGYSLYGHELSTDINPLEAGLDFAIKFDKDYFIGKEALEDIKREGVKREIKAFFTEGRTIPRAGYKVVCENREVGYVTSGTFSPTLEKGIALVLIEKGLNEKELFLDVRGKQRPLVSTDLPFVQGRVKK
ncbi:MAG TPA: glycine cleavage system aminomethyltransferase GcvT [Firmicutes bacterium]|nr:glycine cleavage system aminomethyltransferase GcvT [Bacillota bacterium]